MLKGNIDVPLRLDSAKKYKVADTREITNELLVERFPM